MAEGDRVFVKCAWRLIPFMMLLYLVNFIDRSNVGFAALTMNADLGFSPAVFGFGAGIFFVGYAFFQVPANVILERVGARRWIFWIMAMWGLLSASNAFVQSATSPFMPCAFSSASQRPGFFPGMLLYLTYWFPRAYLARFTASFMVAIPLSFVVGGPLASLILGMDGIAGLHGWQWLFLIEGVPAFLLSFAVLKLLPDGPKSAAWLSIEEKTVIAVRLNAEDASQGRDNLWRVLRDPRVVALGVANFSFQSCAYGVALWLPQMVQAMGFSNRAIGVVVALPFVAGAAAMMLGGRSSSIRGERIWHVALPWLVTALCFAIASSTQSIPIALAAVAIGLINLLAGQGTFYSLPSSFLSGTAAAGGIGLFNTLGSLGGFFGPTFIGVLTEGTGNYAAGMAAVAVGFVVSVLIVLGVGRAIATRPAMLMSKAGGAG